MAGGGADYAEFFEIALRYLDWARDWKLKHGTLAGISVMLDTVDADEVLADDALRARVEAHVDGDVEAADAIMARIAAGNVRSYAYLFCGADGRARLPGYHLRPATWLDDPEDIIGVISANPSVVGDGDIDRWKGKYLRDDFGAYVWEDYEVVEWTETVTEIAGEVETMRDQRRSYAVDQIPDGATVPADATRTTQQRRRLNPAYDPDLPYTPRADRLEWDTVGLMGKLRLHKGQPVGARWIKMRDVSDDVEEWLVR